MGPAAGSSVDQLLAESQDSSACQTSVSVDAKGNLRPYRAALLVLAVSLIPITVWLTKGPLYMRYLAFFYLGTASCFVLMAALGRLRRS